MKGKTTSKTRTDKPNRRKNAGFRRIFFDEKGRRHDVFASSEAELDEIESRWKEEKSL